MAQFELSIYGENDEVLKKYETNVVRWDIFIQAVDIHERFKKLSVSEQVRAVGDLLKCLFIGLNDEELKCADYKDIMNTFSQIVSLANGISKGNSKKG